MRTRDFICNPQTEYIQNLLEKRIRTDRRDWKECRLAEISFDKDSGASIATLGNTKILCILESEIVAPRKTSRPGAGSIQFSMEILTMAHPSSSDSGFDHESEECLTMLETLYRDTGCIDFDTLCISVNQYVFDIKCTLRVLDYDGGLFDCATLAVTTALMGFKRNDVTYDGITKKLITHSASEKPMVPLTMIYKPTTVTFGFIDKISDPIVDPSESECVCIEGFLIIGANRRGEICLMYQSGRLVISSDTIVKCSAFAIQHAKQMVEQMSKQVFPQNRALK